MTLCYLMTDTHKYYTFTLYHGAPGYDCDCGSAREPCVPERREVDKKQQQISFTVLRKDLCPPLKNSET